MTLQGNEKEDKMSDEQGKVERERHLSQSDIDFIRKRKLARTLAMQFIFSLDSQGDWSWDEGNFANVALTALLLTEESETPPLRSDYEEAQKFAKRISKGTALHREELDFAIKAASQNWSLERMPQVDRAILRVASYELIFEEKIPAGTSINEAVELAKAFGEEKSPRFINGVLDKIRENCGKASRKTSKGKK